MKYLFFFLLVFATTFAQNWQNELDLFNLPSQCKINSCVSNKGIHVLYTHNGGVKYALTLPNGTIIKKDVVIENEGSGCSIPAIASVNNEVYAFYIKNNALYVAKSSNLGDSWALNYSYYALPTSNCDTVIALLDNNSIHVVWSGEKSSGYSTVNYVRFNYNSPTNWAYYKEVTDAGGGGDIPATAVSQDKIHISYRLYSAAKSRDMLKADFSWGTPQTIADGVMGTLVMYQNIFSINNKLHAVVKSEYTSWEGNPYSRIYHYERASDNLTWQSTGAGLSAYYNYGQVSASTVNNKIHLIYYDVDNSIWAYRTFENGDWSSPIAYNIWFCCSKTLIAVGNDLYLTYNWNEDTPSAVCMRHYNDAPISPLNFTLSTSPAWHPYLSWTNNDPEVFYNSSNGFVLERRLGGNTNPPVWSSWAPFAGINGNTNCFEDQTINNATGAGPGIAEYRLRANDNMNFSPYTNSLDIHYGISAEKIIGGNKSLNSNSYNLLQNFPNPFNPSTEINYQLPSDGNVKLKVYNIMGQEVMTLVNGFKEKGMYSVSFNAGNLPSGVYIYKIEAGNYTQVKKMLLTK